MNNDILSRYEQAQELMQGILTNRLVMNDEFFPIGLVIANSGISEKQTRVASIV